MIDIGLSKLMVVGVVALIVIGPEKLPRVARMAGTLFGRAQRYMNEVKAEVSREIELDELRKVKKDFEDAANKVHTDLNEHMHGVEQEVNSIWTGNDNTPTEHWHATPTNEQLARKAKSFRKKRLARTSAVPSWYKNQTGQKRQVMSAAARVAKYRPAAQRSTSRNFFPQ